MNWFMVVWRLLGSLRGWKIPLKQKVLLICWKFEINNLIIRYNTWILRGRIWKIKETQKEINWLVKNSQL